MRPSKIPLNQAFLNSSEFCVISTVISTAFLRATIALELAV